jgi:transposase
MIIIFLPAYSPDYNPIELGFSAFKSYIRAHDATFRYYMSGDQALKVDLLRELISAVYTSITPEKAREWFQFCGYIE